MYLYLVMENSWITNNVYNLLCSELFMKNTELNVVRLSGILEGVTIPLIELTYDLIRNEGDESVRTGRI